MTLSEFKPFCSKFKLLRMKHPPKIKVIKGQPLSLSVAVQPGASSKRSLQTILRVMINSATMLILMVITLLSGLTSTMMEQQMLDRPTYSNAAAQPGARKARSLPLMLPLLIFLACPFPLQAITL